MNIYFFPSKAINQNDRTARTFGIHFNLRLSFFLQWIQCDVRKLDYDVLGKFAVVMADPPWDIHMEVNDCIPACLF